jgi:hypothetical protein
MDSGLRVRSGAIVIAGRGRTTGLPLIKAVHSSNHKAKTHADVPSGGPPIAARLILA